MKINVAAIQIQGIWGDKAHNLQRVELIMEEALRRGADFFVLPELWNSAYDDEHFAELPEMAEDVNGPSLSFLREKARKHGVFIGGGSIVESRHGKLYNSSFFINPAGEILGKYRKAHLFGREKEYFSPGEEWGILSDEQNLPELRVGMAICYDLRFPEFFRNMVLRGARLFTLPVAWPDCRREEYILMTRARAAENRSVFVSANLRDKEGKLAGSSLLVSQFGEILDLCKEPEGFAFAQIDLDKLLDPNAFFPLNDRRQFLDEIDDNLL
ncbi:MAG: nitrilase-related carbon-nitrogen hydrolase [Bacillota bacterium]|nr:nitrilase-related carbon-nitrogen hydrolase [Bacillota bacterium]